VKRTLWTATALGLGVMLFCSGPFGAQTSRPDALALQARDRALVGARIFDPSLSDSGADRPNTLVDRSLTTCSFVPGEPTGTTPKFDCRLGTGEKIKVKYGWTREIAVEAAATWLLRRLGFGADRVWRVKRLRCYGCVISPFHVQLVASMLHLSRPFASHLNYNHAIDFVNVSVERKLDGESVEADSVKGWGFDELAKITPSAGGASAAEVDALRLMAVFLNHWDNKPSNQRLVCVHAKSAQCEHPVAMIQDTGSDFGPYKLNLDHWRTSPVWSDHSRCSVSMRHLPYHGGTFQDVRISEPGRRLLLQRLMDVSEPELSAIFQDAGFPQSDQWVAAYLDRVAKIRESPPCAS